MNKYFLLIFLPITLIADDLIVDQNSLTQYEADDYLLFDPFGGDNFDFCGNIRPPNGSPQNCDQVDLGDSGPILGTTFTLEAWVYSDSTTVNHRGIIGDSFDPSGNSIQRPPTITYNYNHQIRYGFGTGTTAARFIVSNVRTEKDWDHVAFTFDGITCNLFVNGEEVPNESFYFFDAQNYYPIAIETTQLGQPVSITMSDYQEVEGLYFPFTISQGGQPIDVKEIILNPEIDYSIFSFPEN